MRYSFTDSEFVLKTVMTSALNRKNNAVNMIDAAVNRIKMSETNSE